jgi:hypothetical protein
MVAMAFSMLVAVFTDYFEHATPAFVDYVACLVEFAFNRNAEEIAMGALHLLQSCAAQLTTAAAIPAEAATLPSSETPLPDSIPEGITTDAAAAAAATAIAAAPVDLSVPPPIVPVAGSRHQIAPPSDVVATQAGADSGTVIAAAAAAAASAAATGAGAPGPAAAAALSFGALTMDEFFLRWFPILSGLSRIVIDCEALAVRRKGTRRPPSFMHTHRDRERERRVCMADRHTVATHTHTHTQQQQ